MPLQRPNRWTDLARSRCLRLGALAAALLLTGCPKRGGFMDFLKDRPATTDRPAPTSLSKAQLVEQLRGLDVRLAAEDGAAVKKVFMLCERERPRIDAVALVGDRLQVDYEAEADGCPATWYKDAPGDVSHGTGYASFHYQLLCGGVDAGGQAAIHAAKSDAFVAAQTFHADGAVEAACLKAGGGKTQFRIEAVRSYGMDVADREDPKRTATYANKDSFTALQADGQPCAVEQGSDGAVTIHACVYTSRLERDESYSFKTRERLNVVMEATAQDLVAKPGERFYASGTLELHVNGWRGQIVFKDGARPPEAELSDGKQTVRVRMNGAFTEAVP
jgi:hypothetical protein